MHILDVTVQLQSWVSTTQPMLADKTFCRQHSTVELVVLLLAGSYWKLSCFALLGLKPTAEAFFIMLFTLTMVSYTATSMALAIATGHDVVAVANLFMTITFVFMIVSSIVYFTREKSKLHRFQPNSAERLWGWVWICAFQNNLGLGARRGEFPCGILSSSSRQSTASNVEKCSQQCSLFSL